MKRRTRFQLTTYAVLVASSVLAAQMFLNTHRASAASDGGMPDRFFYPHIFRHIIHLQNEGVGSSASGQPSLSTSDYYSRRAGMSIKEIQIMVQAAQTWKSNVDPLDAEAGAIIDQIHAMTPGGRLGAGQSPPVLPQRLVDLQGEKDASTANTVATLINGFGAERFSQIDKALRSLSRTRSHGSPSSAVTSPLVQKEEQQ